MAERLTGKVPYSDEDLKELMEENEVSTTDALASLPENIVDPRRLEAYRTDLRMRSSAGRSVAELAKELQQHPEIITGAGEEDTVDGFVTLLVHAFRSLSDAEHRTSIDLVCGAICEVAEFEREQGGADIDSTPSTHLGLRAIVCMFNTSEDRPLSRLACFNRLVELTKGTALLSPLVPLLSRAHELAASWGAAVPAAERRSMLMGAASAL